MHPTTLQPAPPAHDVTDTDAHPADVRAALDRALADALPALAFGLTVLWLALAAGHFAVLSGHALRVMLLLALGTSAVLGALWLKLRLCGSLVPARAHPVGAAVVLLLALNSIAHVAVTGDIKQSTNIALLTVSAGCFFTSLRWFLAITLIVLAAWVGVVSQIAGRDELIHFSFMNFIAAALAILVLRNHARLIVSNHLAARTQAEQAEKLRQLSLTDSLTGLANRRAFDVALRLELERAARTSHPLSALVIDVDHFKRYNDTFGHLAGDQCLRQVAAALRSAVRGLDTLSRFGGEEFVALLPESSLEQAFKVAERARAAVEAARIPHAHAVEHDPQCVTVSIGVASSSVPGTVGAGALLESADGALYRAKAAGRNCVRAHAAVATTNREPA